MNIYSLPALISFTINASVALLILMDDPKATLNKWFAAFVALFAFWNLSEILILNVHKSGNAIFIAQVLYRIIFIVPAFFVIIAYKFPSSFHKFSNSLLFYFIVILLPVVLLLLSFPTFHIQTIRLNSESNSFYYKFYFKNSLVFLSQLIVSIIYFTWGLIVLLRKISKLKTIKHKNQTLFFAVGFFAILILFALINIFRSWFEQTVSFYLLSTLLTFLISLFFLYVLLHYKIFQVNKIIKSGIIYSTLSSIVLAIYFLIIQSTSLTVSKYFNINSFFFTTILIIVLVFLMRPLEKLLQNKIDNFLRKDFATYRHNFSIFTKQLQEYKSLNVFFEFVKSFIEKNFFTGEIILFIYDDDSSTFHNEIHPNEILSVKENKYFFKTLIEFNRATEIFEFNITKINKDLLDYFDRHNIQIIVPFIFEEKLLAIIFIAEKKYADKFTEDEIEKLTIMSGEVSLAFHRNQMFEDLQRKIKDRYRLENLASIGQMTAGIAHEIRNPLNTISLSVQTLKKKEISEDDKNDLMNYISEEINRLERILQDFLKLSKERKINLSKVKIENLFDRVILALERENNKNIKINKFITSNHYQFITDEDILYQSLLNLGMNAFDAVMERCETDASFKCKDAEIKFSFSDKNNFHIIRVEDNGIGIRKETGNKIFDPFFTTKEEGTGLGLSIVNNIIGLLSGTITYKSEFGKTEFIIKLKLN